MPDQVQVPAVGKVQKRWVFAGLGVSAGIVAYAYWRRRSAATTVPPGEGDVTAADLTGAGYGSQAGGGVDAYSGAVGGQSYQDVLPNQPPLTNAEWTQRVVDLLVSVAGYDPAMASQTVGKYLSGQALTLPERILIQTAIALLGNPPAGALPIISAVDSPVGTTPPPVGGTTAIGKHHYAVQVHQISVRTAARSLVQRFSDQAVATPNNVETALRQTTADPRNARYLPYYASSRGYFPAQAKIYLHVVKAG